MNRFPLLEKVAVSQALAGKTVVGQLAKHIENKNLAGSTRRVVGNMFDMHGLQYKPASQLVQPTGRSVISQSNEALNKIRAYKGDKFKSLKDTNKLMLPTIV